jgi:hypothetical protein
VEFSFLLGPKSRFFHVLGGPCGLVFHSFDFQRTLVALSGERSRFESGFQEKELDTLRMERLHGACRLAWENSGNQRHPVFMYLFHSKNNSALFITLSLQSCCFWAFGMGWNYLSPRDNNSDYTKSILRACNRLYGNRFSQWQQSRLVCRLICNYFKGNTC